MIKGLLSRDQQLPGKLRNVANKKVILVVHTRNSFVVAPYNDYQYKIIKICLMKPAEPLQASIKAV